MWRCRMSRIFPWGDMIKNCFDTVVGTQKSVCSSHEIKRLYFISYNLPNPSHGCLGNAELSSWVLSLYKVSPCLCMFFGNRGFHVGMAQPRRCYTSMLASGSTENMEPQHSNAFQKEYRFLTVLFSSSMFSLVCIVTDELVSKVSSSNWEITLVAQGSSLYIYITVVTHTMH